MYSPESMDSLAYAFFREIARCEYCLKAVGLRKTKGTTLTADWGSFAAEVQSTFDNPPSEKLEKAVSYYLAHPPKKQVLQGGILAWDDTPPDNKSKAELVLRLVYRVRNNLFHGGKFNGEWFKPQRSGELLEHGLIILSEAISAHPKVRAAYVDSTNLE